MPANTPMTIVYGKMHFRLNAVGYSTPAYNICIIFLFLFRVGRYLQLIALPPFNQYTRNLLNHTVLPRSTSFYGIGSTVRYCMAIVYLQNGGQPETIISYANKRQRYSSQKGLLFSTYLDYCKKRVEFESPN